MVAGKPYGRPLGAIRKLTSLRLAENRDCTHWPNMSVIGQIRQLPRRFPEKPRIFPAIPALKRWDNLVRPFRGWIVVSFLKPNYSPKKFLAEL